MERKHIAFCVEPAYGHIIPTLGITQELLRRGHKVSFPVPESFAPIVEKVKARPKIIRPLENRTKINSLIIKENDCFNFKLEISEAAKLGLELTRDRTLDSLGQLERLYKDDQPDVIIHNTAQDTAARELASKWGIAKIRHQTQFIEMNPSPDLEEYSDENLILLTVPEFFQQEPQALDKRFKFVGFVPEGITEVFDRWQSPGDLKRSILISPTTGMLPQIDFCRIMIDSFRDQPWDVVLSLSGRHDTVSTIDPAQLQEFPPKIRLNRLCCNFELLASSCLFIGQGGQGSTLEAIYHGVPQIVIPPTPYHYSVARRAGELRLGLCMPINDLTRENLLRNVIAVLNDEKMLERVKETSQLMRAQRGAELAADLIEDYLSGRPIK